MALVFFTKYPNSLLADFKKKIDEDHIVTWSYDEDGDFTHTPDQWVGRAWLRPLVDAKSLSFTIFPPRDQKLLKVVYAVYHGRFMESMLSHCDKGFDDGFATALAQLGDKV